MLTSTNSKLSSRFLLLSLFISVSVFAQNTYTAAISGGEVPILSGHLKLGTNKSPAGQILDANSQYFIKNGKPWYPVMGEFHFSRYPRQQWEESILKMKAAGIDVIASYVFWIYHEEEEGKFNWSGANDLRAFAALCKKHKVFFFARIGPWCHGEVRNGGLPDWIIKKGNFRKNTPEYLQSAGRFYSEVGQQLKGLYFKDGGPVIGSQIENEYRFNNAAGLEHMLTLKKMAIEAGIDVPYYTATAWQGANQKQNELVLVWGAYPEAPWDKKTARLKLSDNYVFSTLRNDPLIGSDLLGARTQQEDYKGYLYPYATAEMGGGNQITYHRRPIIVSDDVTALAYTKAGSGANLMGYYMFHGGSNPIGKFSALQESKATNYPNDYPIISYDFLSPIGEWGQLRPSYRNFKTFHTFLNEFGEQLVQYYPSFPDKKPAGPDDKNTLRFAVRSKDNSGFIFINNYQRQLEMQDIEGVNFSLKLAGGKFLSFPEKPVTVKKNLQAVFPFNMNLSGVNLRAATAQPYCLIKAEIPLYVFFSPEGIQSEYVFDKGGIASVKAEDAAVANKAESFSISVSKAGTGCLTEIILKNGKKVKILTLTAQQIANAWKANAFGAERLFISSQDLIFPEGSLRLQNAGESKMSFSVYPDAGSLSFSYGKALKGNDGIFTSYTISMTSKELKPVYREVTQIEKFLFKGKPLPLDDRNAKNTPASPGPQYQTMLAPVKNAKYYEIEIPKGVLKNLSDVFLTINYTGDTGAAYLDGKLIADDFYSGLPMTIGLKRFGAAADKKLLLQVVPLTDERQIFFEDGIREPLKGKEAASVSAVKLVLQYEVTVTSGR